MSQNEIIDNFHKIIFSTFLHVLACC